MKNIIYITGYGVVSSLGIGKEETRKNLFDGISGISDITLKYADRNVTSAFGGITKDLSVDSFFVENNISPDRILVLAMLAVDEAIIQSKILEYDINVLKVGVVVGTSLGGMLSGDKFHTDWLINGIEKADASLIKQYPLHAVADIVAKKYGFNGTKIIVSTACSSGANALTLASDLLNDSMCDIVIAGGVDPISRFSFAGFTSLGAINRNACQPYSNSKGINIGEGSAFFVLESQRNIKNRDSLIIAEIPGYGLTADAYHPTAPNVNGNGAIRAMNIAISDSGILPNDISYINGHGTGTPANDSAEKKAWKTFVGENKHIPLVSNKGAIGHCMGAAGAVEIALSLMSIEDKIIPPTNNFDNNSESETNFVPNKSMKADVKTVLSNSFAFGGNNCSVITSLPGICPSTIDDKPSQVVITGLGCVGVGGNSIEEFFEMLSRGIPNFETLNLCDKDYSSPFVGKSFVDDDYFKKFILPKNLRRLDKITKLTMASGRQAILDSKLLITQENDQRVGVIYGTATGPSNTIKTISEHIIKSGIDGISSDLFANSVLNAAPGHFSIANNLKGVTSTVSNGNASGINAFIYATLLLKFKKADAIIVISSDEWDDTLQVGNEKLGLLSKEGNLPFSKKSDGMILSEGSVAFVLARKDYAKEHKLKIYAEVKGYFSNSNNPPLSSFDCKGDQWKEGFSESLKFLNGIDIDYYASTSGGFKDVDKQESELINTLMPNSLVCSIPRLIGTPFGSLGSYGLLSGIYSLINNKSPNIGNMVDVADEYKNLFRSKNHTNINNVATSVASFGGAYAGVVLSDLL